MNEFFLVFICNKRKRRPFGENFLSLIFSYTRMHFWVHLLALLIFLTTLNFDLDYVCVIKLGNKIWTTLCICYSRTFQFLFLNFAIKNNWATELSSSRLVKNAKQIQCRITNMHKIELYYEWVQIANWISFQSNVINFRCKNLHILISTTLFIHFLNIVTNDLLCSYVHKIRLNKNFITVVLFFFIYKLYVNLIF